MDFGNILDKWEKQGRSKNNIDNNKDKDVNALSEKDKIKLRRSRLLKQKPDAYIDLHGLTRDEAWSSLEAFFNTGRTKGFEKLKVIHGKGNHSNNEAPLRSLTRQFIENCIFAGEYGFCDVKDGGRGATWILLKNGSQR